MYTETPTTVTPPSPLPRSVAFVSGSDGRFTRHDLSSDANGPDMDAVVIAQALTQGTVMQLLVNRGGMRFDVTDAWAPEVRRDSYEGRLVGAGVDNADAAGAVVDEQVARMAAARRHLRAEAEPRAARQEHAVDAAAVSTRRGSPFSIVPLGIDITTGPPS